MLYAFFSFQLQSTNTKEKYERFSVFRCHRTYWCVRKELIADAIKFTFPS